MGLVGSCEMSGYPIYIMARTRPRLAHQTHHQWASGVKDRCLQIVFAFGREPGHCRVRDWNSLNRSQRSRHTRHVVIVVVVGEAGLEGRIQSASPTERTQGGRQAAGGRTQEHGIFSTTNRSVATSGVVGSEDACCFWGAVQLGPCGCAAPHLRCRALIGRARRSNRAFCSLIGTDGELRNSRNSMSTPLVRESVPPKSCFLK